MQKTISALTRSFKNYGGSAQKIYDECCDSFGWDKQKRGNFATQKLLYAMQTTPEGYSPWFICHSNWTNTENEKWVNEISRDWNTIKQTWKVKPPYEPFPDIMPRVVFAKKDGGYLFLGVYEISPIKLLDEGDGIVRRVNTYSCVSKCYPIISE